MHRALPPVLTSGLLRTEQLYTRLNRRATKMHGPDKGTLPAGTITAWCSEHQISHETQFRLLQLTEIVVEAQCRKGGTDRQTRGLILVPGGADNGNGTSARETQLQTSSANLNFHVPGTASLVGRVRKPQNWFDTPVLLICLLYNAGSEVAVTPVPVTAGNPELHRGWNGRFM
jgi:hypothetical protein